jgi:hypothetical protein
MIGTPLPARRKEHHLSAEAVVLRQGFQWQAQSPNPVNVAVLNPQESPPEKSASRTTLGSFRFACDADVVQLLPASLARAVIRQQIDHGFRVAHEDRRVRGDDELRSLIGQVMEAANERQAAGRRQRSLGLIEDIEPFGLVLNSKSGQRAEKPAD